MGIRTFRKRSAYFMAGLLAFMLSVALASTPALASPENGADLDAAMQSAPSKAASPSAAQQKAFKQSSADFSLELFQRCVAAKGKNANVTVAPMSVMSALAVTANGADGLTAKQMRTVLGDGASIGRINKNLRWYNAKLTNTSRAKLSSANAIWYNSKGLLRMNKGFLAKAKKYYKAKVNGADFSSPTTVDEINGWVAKKTGNMIKRIVNQLFPADRVVLVNALYFDAKWKVPFEKERTTTKAFTDAKGKKHKVKMMHSTESKYIKGANAVGFIKPYAKGYSYVALLPKKGMSLKRFVKSLDGSTFQELVSTAKRTTVHVAMPKYSVSYTNKSMERQLKAMGMKQAFKRTADFSKMGTDPTGNLYIGSVVHKTKVDVDEAGTKAAAATAVMMKANAMPSPEAKKVTLNRPFVYIIIDNSTKLPVFIGTVNNIGK